MNLYREEIIFVKCFLAALYLAGVEKFEFRGEVFENKIDEVEKSLKNLTNDLVPLFIKTSIYGTRARLYVALWSYFPTMWFIKTSNYNEANIQIAGGRRVAIQILEDYAPGIGLNIESFRRAAEAFTGKKI